MTPDLLTPTIQALYDRLSGDATLGALLASSVIDGSQPGVYTALPAPQGAELPYVCISGPISDVPDDAFDASYRVQLFDVHCYADKPDGGGASVAEVNAIAERVRALLHRQPLSLAGSPRNLVCEVSGLRINDDVAAFGRTMTVRLLSAA